MQYYLFFNAKSVAHLTIYEILGKVLFLNMLFKSAWTSNKHIVFLVFVGVISASKHAYILFSSFHKSVNTGTLGCQHLAPTANFATIQVQQYWLTITSKTKTKHKSHLPSTFFLVNEHMKRWGYHPHGEIKQSQHNSKTWPVHKLMTDIFQTENAYPLDHF